MSHWRCLLKDIAEAGGEDLMISSLPGWGVTETTAHARKDLLKHGFIKPTGGRRHSMTGQGWRVAFGAADMVEPKAAGKRGHVSRAYSLIARGETVSDIVIEDLLTECGVQPGAAISPEIIRAYSAKLAAVVRASV